MCGTVPFTPGDLRSDTGRDPAMPNEFTVVGEHRDDETQLLVVGTDGMYYGYQPAREQISPVEPDEHWTVYPTASEALQDDIADAIGFEPISRAAEPER